MRRTSKNKLPHTSQHGFTFVEIVIIAPIVILAIGAFVATVVSMTSEVLRSRASNVLTYNVQDALNRIEQDIKLSSTFLAQTNVDLASTQQGYETYDSGSHTLTNQNASTTPYYNVDLPSNDKGQMLILNALATTDNPISSTSQVAYLKDQPNGCGPDQNKNTPLTYNIVYYVKTVNDVSSLWRRTILPNSYASTACNAIGSPSPGLAAPWQQPSCTPDSSGTYNGNSFCKTNDVKLVDGVSKDGFLISYYNAGSSTTENTAASTTIDPVARQSALSSATTASVGISATQYISGKAIEQTGSIRATRLDVNASSINVANTTATTPTTPVVTGTYIPPASATFSWPASNANGSITYSAEYQIDGTGGWTTALTNSTQRTFTVSPGHNHTVTVHVTASTSAGTSSVGTASITVPQWATLLLQNGWTDYENGYSTAGYTKLPSGLVVLKGLVKGGSGTIATLPVGYRVAANEQLLIENSSNQTAGRVDIKSNGDIYMSVGSNAWFSLDGITFMPSGSATFTNFSSFSNGWLNYSPGSGDPNWAQASYFSDPATGRVVTRGLVRSGNSAGGTIITTLPSSLKPSEYLHIVNINSNANNHISIDTSGNILAKGGSNAYLGTNTMFYPAGRSTGTSCSSQWCNLTLLNGWTFYGSIYATPQYTKSSDGLVMLKGLIKSGSTSLPIASLPYDYCPTQRLLLTTQAADAWSRIDITPRTASGCDITPSAVSTTWTSLDAIKFYPGQY